MSSRHQRRKRAKLAKQTHLVAKLVGMGTRERDLIVNRNLSTPIERDYTAGVYTSSVVLCERMGSRSNGIPRVKRQVRVDGQWQ